MSYGYMDFFEAEGNNLSITHSASCTSYGKNKDEQEQSTLTFTAFETISTTHIAFNKNVNLI